MLTIAHKLVPFSHQSGHMFMLAGSDVHFKIYPTRLEVFKGSSLTYILHLNLQGVVKDFTASLDIQRQELTVLGFAEEGYFRYTLYHENGVVMLMEKAPAQGLSLLLEEIGQEPKEIILAAKDKLTLGVSSLQILPKEPERLSFGCHKKQEWEAIKKRSSSYEYLPYWFLLGQYVKEDKDSYAGLLELIKEAKKELDQGKKEAALCQLKRVFYAGFDGVFYPHIEDRRYQGVLKTSTQQVDEVASLMLLKQGYELIRSFFYTYEGHTVSILRQLPREFHSGRLINIEEKKFKVHIEWSKRQVRVIEIESFEDQVLTLKLQQDIASFRLRPQGKTFGSVCKVENALSLKAHTCYILDRFEK